MIRIITVRTPRDLLYLLLLSLRLLLEEARKLPHRTLSLPSHPPTSRPRLLHPVAEDRHPLVSPWTAARIAGQWTC